jgi:threonine dehydrogenase-like Zn-dependent dehydrogenase
MRAIVTKLVPFRYIPLKLLGKLWRGVYLSRLAPLRYRTDWPEPKLPSPEWVRVRPVLGGVCASDVTMVMLGNPPDSFAKAFVSSPFVLGHENVGCVSEVGGAVEGFKVGDRVNVEPTLWCAPRGLDPPCPMCRAGMIASCHNLASGALPPGMSIGFNAATGGAWGECFVAHRSQLFKVPDALTDEQAVLVDPLACCLHAVLRRPPRDDETVLVLGAGAIGIGITSAIRAVGSRARVIVLARHGFQKELCLRREADQVVMPTDYARCGKFGHFRFLAELFGTPVYQGAFGKPILLGGADLVYDAVGSRNTSEDALRLVRAGGTATIVGMGHPRWIDWDPITHKQLTILGAHGRAYEESDPGRRHTYRIVHEMMLDGRLKTDGLLTHTFQLADYRQAIETILDKARTGCVKAAFRI